MYPKFLSVCSEDPDQWTSGRDLSVLLTHQPINWLHPSAQQHFRGEIYPAGRFHAQLCGHQHKAVQYDLSEGGSVPRRIRQGASLFGLEKIGESGDVERIHGYMAGQFEVNGARSLEKLWPRITVQALSGGMRLCPDHQYELDDDECVVTSLALQRSQETEIEIASVESLPSDELVAADDQKRTTEVVIPLLEKTQDEATAKKSLSVCATFTLPAAPHHAAIRLDEQSQFENALRQQRLVWVASDWSTGLEGFPVVGFERFRKQPPEPTAHHFALRRRGKCRFV